MIDLKALFLDIPIPTLSASTNDNFSALPLQSGSPHRLGRDTHGRPVLMLAVNTHQPSSPLPSTVLEHITVSHNVLCQIEKADNSIEEGIFSLICCNSDSPVMQAMFLNALSILLLTITPEPTSMQISLAIRDLAELFRALSKPPTKSIQGLWAELYLISRSKKIETAIRAWHSETNSHCDFCLEQQCVEVKSSANGVRQHYFSLEQVTPQEGYEVLIASMLIEKDQTGKSIWELLEKIRPRLSKSPELAMRVERLVYNALGTNWRYVQEDRFSEKAARDSLLFFRAEDVPSIPTPIPDAVSNVRFMSDLSNVVPVAPPELRHRTGLFAAIL